MREDGLAKIIKDKLVEINQEPEMRQFLGRGKGLQIYCPINLIGDSAIRAALVKDGALNEVMEYLLEVLPPPRLENLKLLAIAVALKRVEAGLDHVTRKDIGGFLGITERSVHYWARKVEAANGSV